MKLRPEGTGEIYLYRHPVDMRKSINGLVAIVEGEMALDPFSASLFVFCNRGRTLVKMVCWGVPRTLACWQAVLWRRWGRAPRSRLSGGDSKPPTAAASKRRGGERVGNGAARLHQVRAEEMSASEPLMTYRKHPDVVETRGAQPFWDQSAGYLITAQMATGI